MPRASSPYATGSSSSVSSRTPTSNPSIAIAWPRMIQKPSLERRRTRSDLSMSYVPSLSCASHVRCRADRVRPSTRSSNSADVVQYRDGHGELVDDLGDAGPKRQRLHPVHIEGDNDSVTRLHVGVVAED